MKALAKTLARKITLKLAKRLGFEIILENGSPVENPVFDILRKGQYDYVPKGAYVAGPADRFLLVPKNRYRVSLLTGQTATDELGVGWVTEQNTPQGYDRLWGDPRAVEAYKTEAAGVRSRMPHEIVGAVAEIVRAARSVCDIGCGVGDLLAAALELNPNLRLSGLDFSPAAIARASDRLPGASLTCHAVHDVLPLPTGAYDVVFCTDVLEHIELRDAFARELVRICAPGGYVVIVVPDGDVDQFFGHLWFYNEERLRAFLSPWKAEVHRLPDCREFMAQIRKPEG